MSLSKITVPSSVMLSGNIMPVTIETDKYRTSLGTKQVLKIEFVDDTTAGKKITFSWKEFDMVLTFATTPNDSGLQLPLYDKTLITGYDTLIAAFRANYYLDRYFVIAPVVSFVSGNYKLVITFTQRSYGQAFAATAITGDDATKYTPSILTAQVMPVYGANFRFLCDVYHQINPVGSREYRLLAELDASGNDENIGTFNLSDVFHNWETLKADFPATSSFQECPNVLQNYYLQFAESYGAVEIAQNNITEPGTIASNTFLQVLKGGMPLLTYPSNTFLADFIDATYNKFLTAQISGKTTVCKAQPNFLYWYQKNGVTDFDLKVTVYFDDGTNTTITSTTYTGAVTGRKVWQIGVGYDELGLDSLLGVGVGPMSYEVWIEDGSSVRLTEKFKFLVDTRWNEYNNFLFFHNQYGGVDSIWLSGDCLLIPESTGIEVQKAILNDYSSGNIEASNSKTRFTYQFYTGHKRYKNEIDHLIQLLQSNDVRLLPDVKLRPGFTDPYNLLKIIIDKASAKDFPADSESIFSLSLKAREAHYEW